MYAREIVPASLKTQFVIVTLCLSLSVCSDLKVLVRLNDGQITEELLQADSQRDTITLEFKQRDGTLITFLADFQRHVKIFRAFVLGEPERGQTQYQALCFITWLDHREIIPTEAMARLRQKNAHLVRAAEERRGVEELSMNVAVNLTRAGHLSSHIHNVCREAQDLVYTRQDDLKHWLDIGVDGSMFEVLTQKPGTPGLQDCSSTEDPWKPCACSYQLSLEWYPCLLKYCRGQGSRPYKCGIKSCSKGFRFNFYTPHKQLCLWDEDS
ncbi:out at first protein homolog [Chanos chanos]|uniref:Out at first protein homolog n=1 Tax=Chanos chanos TaxID=29144 RepID=A0A6J2WXH1_CHACN|nr:out at first protein homolog [Chanos chanos]